MGKDESGRGNGSPNVEIEGTLDLAGTIAGTIEDSTLGGNADSEGDEGFKTGWNCVKEGTDDEGTAADAVGEGDGTCTTSKELNSNSLNASVVVGLVVLKKTEENILF